ncbi:DUF2202 domain-containing protein [Flavobacterium sp. Arc3]|uniref:DUF2202 domain-containing protein n=1 Tax=Flavobacterium sp. Arc3 TaxID=3046686 RepID=UPI00352CF4E2
MKKILLATAVTLMMFSSCSNDNNIASLVSLTPNEVADLKFLREEEKLARDVYMYSFDKYQITIFNSITQSEQQHMDSVLNLLNKYGITDPASMQRGVFQSTELQVLYNSLTAQSAISSTEALKVGATIEDLDIKDIDDFINNTTKSDLLSVYDNLTCGSKNHIRAFTNQLALSGVNYIPQYITIAYYNTILSESNGGCGTK